MNRENFSETTTNDKDFLLRLAGILFFISATALIVSITFVMSFFIMLAYYLILIVILLVTFFALIGKLRPWFDKGQDIQKYIASFSFVLPYLLTISITFSLISFIIYFHKKNYSDRSVKLIASAFISIISLIFIVFRFIILNY